MPITIYNLDDAIRATLQVCVAYAVHEAPQAQTKLETILRSAAAVTEKWRLLRENLLRLAPLRLAEMVRIFNFLLHGKPSHYPHNLVGYQQLLAEIFDLAHYRTGQFLFIKFSRENSDFYKNFIPLLKALTLRPDLSEELARAQVEIETLRARLQPAAPTLQQTAAAHASVVQSRIAALEVENARLAAQAHSNTAGLEAEIKQLTALANRRVQEVEARQKILQRMMPKLRLGELLEALITQLRDEELLTFKHLLLNALYPAASRTSETDPSCALLELNNIHTPETLVSWINMKIELRSPKDPDAVTARLATRHAAAGAGHAPVH